MNTLNFKLSSCLRFIACAALIGIVTSTWADDDAIMSLRETRTSSFQYYGTTSKWAGMLQSETIEPGTPDQCVNTSYVYDNGNTTTVHGNQTSTTVSNCSGASSAAQFSARTSSVAFDGNGQFPVSSTNAAGHTESYGNIDPRFGIAQSQTGPNNLTSTVTLDELGRKVRTTAPDGSYTTTYTYTCSSTDQSVDPQGGYCDQIKYQHPTSNVWVQADSYSETLRYASNGVSQGGVSRTYYDSMGREIGSILLGIDLPGQTTYYRRVLKAYDSQGRQAYTTTAHLVDASGTLQNGAIKRWSVATFDPVGRSMNVYTPDDSGVDISGLGGQTNDGAPLQPVVNGRVKMVGFGYEDGKVKSYQWMNATGWFPVATEQKNALGQLILKTDAYGNQIAYRYDAQGQLVGTSDGAANTTTITFDRRGRKTNQHDPDLGDWTYTYDALGQLKTQTDAKGQTQTMYYDVLGRLIAKYSTDLNAYYNYDCNKATGSTYQGIGSLCNENTSNGYVKDYAFDNLGRTIQTSTYLGAGTSNVRVYRSYQSFDSYGRLQTSTYPTGVQTSPQYSTNGVMIGLNRTDSGMNQALWTAKALNQYGNIQQWQLGNGLITTEWRDVQGRLTGKNTGTVAAPTGIQNLQYTFTQAGDLATRQDVLIGILDTFNHDALHRLVQWVNQNPYQVGGSYTVGYTYDGLGNITYRSDRGSYSYGSGAYRPHALTTLSRPAYNGQAAVTTTMSYDANGSLSQISQNGSVIKTTDWTSFNQPADINWTGSGSQRRVEWLYGSNFQRIQETHLVGNGSGGWNVASKVFKLNPDNQNGLYFEQVVDYSKNSTENRHYLSTPVGNIGMLVTYGEVGSGTTTANAQIRYWHTDHLGSLTALTDDNGSVLERFQYDPFGVQLDAQGNVASTSRYTDRGFTGHEEIADLGLVHMNGRIFDPYTGRFLSADSHIQDPTELQSYNRYSYCWNSPMLCTDPSGYFGFGDILKVAAVVAVAYFAPYLAASIMSTITGTVVTVGTASFGLGSSMLAGAIAGFGGGLIMSGGDPNAAIQGAAFGAVAGGLFYGAGQMASSIGRDLSTASGLGDLAHSFSDNNGVGRALIHALAGCAAGLAQRSGCKEGAISAGLTKYLASNIPFKDDTARFISYSVIGGTTSKLTGGKFANGAMTGAFQYLFNERIKQPQLGTVTIIVRTTGNYRLDDLFNPVGHTAIYEADGKDENLLDPSGDYTYKDNPRPAGDAFNNNHQYGKANVTEFNYDDYMKYERSLDSDSAGKHVYTYSILMPASEADKIGKGIVDMSHSGCFDTCAGCVSKVLNQVDTFSKMGVIRTPVGMKSFMDDFVKARLQAH